MKRLLRVTALCATMLTCAWVPNASADLVFVLDQSGCCGSIDFGTVTLHDTGVSGEVEVTVHLDEPSPVLGITNTGLTSFLFNN